MKVKPSSRHLFVPAIVVLLFSLLVPALHADDGTNNSVSLNPATLAPSSLNTLLLSPLVNRFRSGSAPPIRVLLIGDSMTAYHPSTLHSFMLDLQNIYHNAWGDRERQQLGSISWSGFNISNMAWFTNWWGGVYFAVSDTDQYISIPYTNINTVDLIWFPQPLGSAFTVFTNNAPFLTLNGFSTTTNGAFTNVSIPPGNYTFRLQNVGSGPGKTNVVFAAAGYNTNDPGAVFYETAAGGVSIEQMLNAGTNVLCPIYRGINPDLVLYNAKDVNEPGIADFNGYSNQINRLYVTAQSQFTNHPVWCFEGTMDQYKTGQALVQNQWIQAMCLQSNWVYLDTYVPYQYFTNFYSNDDPDAATHPNQYGSDTLGRVLGEEMGFFDERLSTLTVTSAVSPGDFCLTWSSVPGTVYFVMGTPTLTPPAWTPVSSTITATDVLTTFCIDLPATNHFFRVGQAITAIPTLANQFPFNNVTVSPPGITLAWNAPTNRQFAVQWTAQLGPRMLWYTLRTTFTSTNGVFSFLDDGTKTGGLGPTRFYRLLLMP